MATKFANIDMSDLIIEATFVNPPPAASGNWDYGFILRASGAGASRRYIELVVTSRGTWEVMRRSGASNGSQRLSRRIIGNFDPAANAPNRLQVIAAGSRGWFFINDKFVSAVDLSGITGAGDLAVITRIFAANNDAAVTRYQGFQATRLTHQYGPARGRLADKPNELSGHNSNVWARNFIAEADFTNPPNGDWGYGFAFRNPGFNRLDIIALTNNRQWSHHTRNFGAGDSVARGSIPADIFRNNNHLMLFALEETGLFFVNQQLIARLDLSQNLDHGKVSVMGGFLSAHTGEPDFHNFNVWTPD